MQADISYYKHIRKCFLFWPLRQETVFEWIMCLVQNGGKHEKIN